MMAWIFILLPLYSLLAFILFDLARWDQPERPEIGKTARNERRKLTATFLNNIAVGAVATAAALSLYPMFKLDLQTIITRLDAMPGSMIFDRASGVVGALLLANVLHHWALSILADVED